MRSSFAVWTRIPWKFVASATFLLYDVVLHQSLLDGMLTPVGRFFMFERRISQPGFCAEEMISSKCVEFKFLAVVCIIAVALRRLSRWKSFLFAPASCKAKIRIWSVWSGRISLFFGELHHRFMAKWNILIAIAVITITARFNKVRWYLTWRILWVWTDFLQVHIRMKEILASTWRFTMLDFDPFIIFTKIENIFDKGLEGFNMLLFGLDKILFEIIQLVLDFWVNEKLHVQ
jgi:hypothetical protein